MFMQHKRNIILEDIRCHAIVASFLQYLYWLPEIFEFHVLFIMLVINSVDIHVQRSHLFIFAKHIERDIFLHTDRSNMGNPNYFIKLEYPDICRTTIFWKKIWFKLHIKCHRPIPNFWIDILKAEIGFATGVNSGSYVCFDLQWRDLRWL